MHLPRQEALLLLALLFLLGVAFVLARLVYARKHGFSIRMQVFLTVAAITLVVTAAFGVTVVDRFESRTILFAHRAARDDARVVAALVERSIGVLGVSLAQGSRELRHSKLRFGFTKGPWHVRVQLVGRRGEVLFDSLEAKASEGAHDLAGRPEIASALKGRTEDIARRLADGMVAAAVPIRSGNAVIGAVRVSKSAFGMDDVIADIAPKVALLALMLACAAALTGVVVGRSIAAPVERLTRAAGRIAAGQRQAALPVPRGREIRALTSAFEGMRRELERRDAVEALAADLSHELKNPVASIQASAEVLQDAIENDLVASRRFARRVSESAERLGTLLRDLLALAHLEARGLAEKTASLEIAELIEHAVARVQHTAESRGIRFEVACGTLRVRGNREWLLRALENLLANALAYTPRECLVTVEAREADRHCEILVIDAGPGVDEAVRDRLFDRFVTTRHEDGGSGLGLAIVRAVAEAHGGRAELRAPSDGPGATFALALPRG